MKALRIIAPFVLCSFVHLNKIYAQKDYVITKNRDTIFCHIKGGLLNGILKYRGNKDNKYIKIDSADVIEYFIADDTTTWVVKNLPGKIYRYTPYLKWLIKGRINLYEQQVPTGSQLYQRQTSSIWYANKGDDSLKLIKTEWIALGRLGTRKEREQAFMGLIADFPGLLEGFKSKSYTLDNIEDCIVTYNSEFSHQ